MWLSNTNHFFYVCEPIWKIFFLFDSFRLSHREAYYKIKIRCGLLLRYELL